MVTSTLLPQFIHTPLSWLSPCIGTVRKINLCIYHSWHVFLVARRMSIFCLHKLGNIGSSFTLFILYLSLSVHIPISNNVAKPNIFNLSLTFFCLFLSQSLWLMHKKPFFNYQTFSSLIKEYTHVCIKTPRQSFFNTLALLLKEVLWCCTHIYFNIWCKNYAFLVTFVRLC